MKNRITPGSGTRHAPTHNEIEALERQIIQLSQRGAHREAALVAEHAIARFPKAPSLLNAAAIAAINGGQANQAEEYWLRCIQLDPRMPTAQLNIGRYYFNTKQYSHAEQHLRKAAALNPRSSDAINCLGALHQAVGDFAAARKCYQQALVLEPHKAEAINNLGVCLIEQKKYAEAHDCLQRMLALPGQKAKALTLLGTLAEAQGRYPEATNYYEQSITVDPSDAFTVSRFAKLLSSQGNHGRATVLIEQTMQLLGPNPILLRALAQCAFSSGNIEYAKQSLRAARDAAPMDADTILAQATLCAQERDHGQLTPLLGVLVQAMPNQSAAVTHAVRLQLIAGLKQDAVMTARNALARMKKSASLLCALGDALVATGDYEQADAAYVEALKLDPAELNASLGLGLLLCRNEHYADAAQCYRQALVRHPGNLKLLAGLAQTFISSGKLDQAAEIIEPLYASNPSELAVSVTYSHFARFKGHPVAALEAAENAVKCEPNELSAKIALVVALEEAGSIEQATNLANEMLLADPTDSECEVRLATLLLAQGRFREGWQAYEARLVNMLSRPHPYMRMPRWTGEALEYKTLLVAHEQGLGDELQFYRYLPILKRKLNCHIELVCKPSLHSLLKAQCDFPVHSFENLTEDQLPAHDYWVPLMSIPHVAREIFPEIPGETPYIHVPSSCADSWKVRLSAYKKENNLLVGLAWKGNPDHKNDIRRSVPDLGILEPILRCTDVQFFSLQKGIGEVEANTFSSRYKIANLGPDIHDVMDTAAIMLQLDLVISVDSMPAHLAGAIGAPCWSILPSYSEWRWLITREDSPWYPSMRLYRQKTPGDWAELAQRIATDLEKMLAEKRA